MSKKGFTLVELLVVVAIIGVLAAALLIGLDPLEQVRKARDGGKISQAKEVVSACERYYAVQGTFPADCAALETAAELKSGSCANIDSIGTNPCTATVTMESVRYIDVCGASCVVPTGLSGVL